MDSNFWVYVSCNCVMLELSEKCFESDCFAPSQVTISWWNERICSILYRLDHTTSVDHLHLYFSSVWVCISIKWYRIYVHHWSRSMIRAHRIWLRQFRSIGKCFCERLFLFTFFFAKILSDDCDKSESFNLHVLSRPDFLRSFSVATATGDIMSAGLFFQLLASATTLAVFMVGIETSPVKSLLFCISVQGMTYNMLITYAYCLCSEMISADLAAIGDIFYGCAWYRMPVKQQNRLMLPIKRAQLKFRLYGLGFVECSLKTYTSVRSDLNWIFVWS